MVTVLIPGKYYCVTCPHCNAVLRYEKEDMKQTLIQVNQHLSHTIKKGMTATEAILQSERR